MAGQLKDPDDPSPTMPCNARPRTYHLGVQGNHRHHRALQCAQRGEFVPGRHPGTAGTGKRDRRSAASAARSARRISPPGNGASQAGPARRASHTTTPGVAVSWEWTPVRGKGGERTMAATIMPMRRPCKSVRDCAPTASVPDARPSEITHRPPTALRRANTRRPLIARRSLIALPGRTSPGSGTSRGQAPTATPAAASHRGFSHCWAVADRLNRD